MNTRESGTNGSRSAYLNSKFSPLSDMVKRKTTRSKAPKTQAAAMRKAASEMSKAATMMKRAAKMKK